MKNKDCPFCSENNGEFRRNLHKYPNFQCLECDFLNTDKCLFPDPVLLTKTGEVDYFDWNYKFPIKYIQRYRFNQILKLLGKNRYTNLLEAGTGSGIFLPELSKHCEKLYACDIHQHFDKIKYLLQSYNVSNYEYKSQSIEKTDYPDNYFDAIVAVSVLEFVKDLPAAITEIKRILKKDGVFVTICPMESKILDFVVSFYADKKPEDEFGDSRIYVAKALEQNFKVIKKGYLMPIIGKIFPVYTHFKLKK
jgi:ubiquinone/menaquinone biosynthesis C-methylase UbiE